MICDNCGSERIEWDARLTETRCPDCGGKNCQQYDPREDPMITDSGEWEQIVENDA
jgi:predicted  nucleic acid-binding Zn-ribbon protein